ncbi:MAG: hypothetical protein PVF57_20325, partial [Pseudomonadales bacterium]
RLLTFLKNYEFPGNIRELRNIIFRVSCLAAEQADLQHLPEGVRPASTASAAEPEVEQSVADMSLSDAKKLASDEAERRFLEVGLLETGGNVTALAKRIDMNRAHVQTLLKKHGISSKDYKGQPADAASAGAGDASRQRRS